MSAVIRLPPEDPIAIWLSMICDLQGKVDTLNQFQQNNANALKEYQLWVTIYRWASKNGPIHEGPKDLSPIPSNFYEEMVKIYGFDRVTLIWPMAQSLSEKFLLQITRQNN